jgi:hypothetical protein
MNDDSTPPDAAADDAPLQLDRAEPVAAGGPAPSPGPLTCAACRQPIAGQYFELNGNVACGPCRDGIVQHLQGPLGSRRFWRAFWFGSGAAVVSALLWWGATVIANGSEYGFVAIIVGLIVGAAVKKGGRGRGGRKLQLLALLLTYSSIAVAHMPLVIKVFADQHTKNETAAGPKKPDEPLTAGKAIAAVALAIVVTFVIACIAPFLGGAQSILGLMIIGFALWEAWKINRAPDLKVTGPFRVGEQVVVAA